MSKKSYFQCFWGDGYDVAGPEGLTQLHLISFFTEAVGYGAEDVARIEALKIGELADFTSPSGTHTVTRVEPPLYPLTYTNCLPSVEDLLSVNTPPLSESYFWFDGWNFNRPVMARISIGTKLKGGCCRELPRRLGW